MYCCCSILLKKVVKIEKMELHLMTREKETVIFLHKRNKQLQGKKRQWEADKSRLMKNKQMIAISVCNKKD